MNEIREVHVYDEPSRSNTTLIAVLLICMFALAGVVAAVWHPWAAAPPSTTIIREQPRTTVINPPNTTIVTPPVPESRTDIRIDNSKEDRGEHATTGGSDSSTSGETAGGKQTDGGSASADTGGNR